MNQKSNKLTVPDLISVGVFTALYFVLVTVATFACALLPGVGNILLPAVAALISGSVYMLLAAKLQKFGGITIMGLVMGLFFFVSGHFVLSFAANIICGVAADLVAAAGKYRSKKLLLASYVVFSYGLTGPILPLWFMKSAYIANLTARGKLCIAWTDADGNTLGRAVYHLDHVLERGLEGKENALFVAEDVPADWPFRCLLAMEPMPPRAARLQGGLLSHLHFQYASGPEHLFDPDTHALRSPLWYATMCDGDGTLLEQCNIVRALHRLPVWEELPEL